MRAFAPPIPVLFFISYFLLLKEWEDRCTASRKVADRLNKKYTADKVNPGECHFKWSVK